MRPLTSKDVEDVFKAGAPNPDGTYRMSASRFVEGRPMGNFTHFGTRPDDPNDIHPHEHRRELRANRVFAAWINHDDSRALNTLEYVLSVLIERRDKVVQTWLTAVNPLMHFRLAADGTLTFANAAVNLNASTPPAGYKLTWSRFDNATDTHQPVGSESTVSSPSARAPAGLEGSQFVAVSVKTEHPEGRAWAEPVRAYFRREGGGWQPVGLERQP